MSADAFRITKKKYHNRKWIMIYTGINMEPALIRVGANTASELKISSSVYLTTCIQLAYRSKLASQRLRHKTEV